MLNSRGRRCVRLLIAGAAIGGGCASGPAGGHVDAVVAVTVANFRIDMPDTVEHGRVRFEIHNQGPNMHEMVLTRTDLAPGDLPTADDGTVDDSGPHAGLADVDEAEAIDAGDDAALVIDLKPGRYVVYCNMEGHYATGMHHGLVVK